MVEQGDLLWEPSEERRGQANMTEFMEWLERERGLATDGYHELWRWSVEDIEEFWESIWEYYDVPSTGTYDTVRSSLAMPGDDAFEGTMPGDGWFTGTEVNYTEQVFRNRSADHPALLFESETDPLREVSWAELRSEVASVAAGLQEMGVESGDRVVSFMPNVPQTVVGLLACASIGAVWSSCSPDFGTESVLDRFEQLDPKVLFCADGYTYDGKTFDKRDEITTIREALPSLEGTIVVPTTGQGTPSDGYSDYLLWEEISERDPGEIPVERVPFNHPLWVLFSSGTTGPPKPITHSHGGIILEHLKSIDLHTDLDPGDPYFWYTSTSWMVWNYLVSGLLVGATPVLYDGSPSHPDLNVLWELAEKTEMVSFGTSAQFILTCKENGLEPGETHDLDALTTVAQSASPLPPEGFAYVYESIKEDLWFVSTSGGTDICSGFLGGSPLLPVRAGEMQCRALGCKVFVLDESGRRVVDEKGELVVTEPMPSMPIYFWNDPDDERYRASYFEKYPGVWRHGDFMKLTPRGSAIIYGRSDSMINKHGVRFGTSEIYSVVEESSGVADSLAVGIELSGGDYYFPLFVVPSEGTDFDDALAERIREAIRSDLTPRHVPDDLFEISEVPRNLVGKKLEVPVKNILTGTPKTEAVNVDAIENPEALDQFVALSERLELSR